MLLNIFFFVKFFLALFEGGVNPGESSRMNTLTGEELSIPGRSIKKTLRDCITLWGAKGLFYHDSPADEANMDYILIGSAGVFAVETNPRSKRKADRGQSSADVPMMEKD